MLNRGKADIFNSRQSKADGGIIFIILLNGEASMALINVRWEHFDAQPPAFSNRRTDFLHIIRISIEQGNHVLNGVIGLKIGSAVSNEAIANAVGFIKSVTSERLD